MSFEEVKHKFEAINLDPKVIESISKNKKLVARLALIVDLAGGKADKSQGNLLYTISSKLPPTQDPYIQSFVDLVMKNKWTKVLQIDEAIAFLKEKLAASGASYVIEQETFEAASGVGINITDADVTKLVDEAFKLHQKDLEE